MRISIEQHEKNPVYFVTLPSFSWQCGLKYIGIKLQNLENQDPFLLIEINIRGGISGVMDDR